MGDDSQTVPTLQLKRRIKQEFAKRLYSLMTSKGWHQSELARRAGVKRDSISTYIRGANMPDSRNLEKIATAFGVQTKDLLPNHVDAVISHEIPSMELIASADPRVGRLRVNSLVSTATALKIIELLSTDTLPEKK